MAKAADDFVLKRDLRVSNVRWWGSSDDGAHGKTDYVVPVEAFLVEFYVSNSNSNGPGEIFYREVIPRDETDPTPTLHHQLNGSDVFQFTARLAKPVKMKADTRYWFSVSAYLDGQPMWVWFKSDDGQPNAAVDYNVNGVWGDEPKVFPWTKKKSLAFELQPLGKFKAE